MNHVFQSAVAGRRARQGLLACVLLLGAAAGATPGAGGLRLPRAQGAAPPAPLSEPPAQATASGARDARSQMQDEGQLAAAAWLLLLDRRDWGTAWESAAGIFRGSVPLGTWMDGIPKVREPLGALLERSPLEATWRGELQGRPAGDYVTVTFATRFENRPEAQEVVTTVREADGRWRVTGYSTR